ncbi:4ec8d017-a799-404d-8a27-b26c25b000c8 [Sclerotinia trifoliorum]|uniref:Solute carrier family 40 member n=1 Tax=Sclerotinia trifoliorum TaxID=28548 RepID=A0A8H2VZB2_9HELO|nr:4ec8d017-a799-404d-8a27-b26c25b000c8 [Sclerotinia trifoliorum]
MDGMRGKNGDGMVGEGEVRCEGEGEVRVVKVKMKWMMMDGDGMDGINWRCQNESHSDDGLGDEEEDALILNAQEEPHTELAINTNTNMEMEIDMDKAQAWNLYLSHLLSTWNGRSYEFAAIIFTANAWPDTLFAASIRGIVRTLASICFSSSVGRWVDKSPDRLKTLLTTITINRIAVICASILWFFVVESESSSDEGMSPGLTIENMTVRNAVKISMFALILGFGILEGLSANGNMLSMERDWVVVAAAPEGKGYDLTHLNSTMRRIDLCCRLLAPILISFLVSTLGIKIGVVLVGGMNAATWGVEMWCARRVWKSNTRLQMRKDIGHDEVSSNVQVRSLIEKIARGVRLYREDFQNYFSSKVWIPSLSLSLLHLSALSYGATFITFLLNVGFSLDVITLARAVGSVFEISSTVVTPFGVRHLSKARGHGQYDRLDRSDDSDESLLEEEHEIDESGRVATGLERLGLWGLSWQLINLIPVTLILWTLSSIVPTNSIPTLLPRIIPSTNSILLPLLLFTTLSFSRLGLWIFDLTTQQLTQTLVTPTQRSSFTGCEYSLVAFFELGNNVMAMVWSRPEQFKWVALVSLAAVGLSAVIYAGWVRSVRGHLVHWERVCRCTKKCGRG